MSNDRLKEQKERLIKEIANVSEKQGKKRRINSIAYTILVLMGIALSAGAALAGFIDAARIAGILALLAAASVSVESAFKFGEKGISSESSPASITTCRSPLNIGLIPNKSSG